MARNVYGTGKTAKDVAEALGKLRDVIDDEVMAVVDEVAAEGEKVAREKCPASQVAFGHKTYPSNGYLIQIEARGPKVYHKASEYHGVHKGAYSFPLVKLLEYGTGFYGEHDKVDNGANHRYVPNMSGMGGKGWYYQDRVTGETVFTHGIYPRHFMFHGAQAMRERMPGVIKAHLDANKLKKEAGL